MEFTLENGHLDFDSLVSSLYDLNPDELKTILLESDMEDVEEYALYMSSLNLLIAEKHRSTTISLFDVSSEKLSLETESELPEEKTEETISVSYERKIPSPKRTKIQTFPLYPSKQNTFITKAMMKTETSLKGIRFLELKKSAVLKTFLQERLSWKQSFIKLNEMNAIKTGKHSSLSRNTTLLYQAP